MGRPYCVLGYMNVLEIDILHFAKFLPSGLIVSRPCSQQPIIEKNGIFGTFIIYDQI